MIQIEFLSDNVIDALVPVLSLAPRQVVYFYDPGKLSETYINNIRKALHRHLQDTDIDFRSVDMYSLSKIKARLTEATAGHEAKEVCIDLTGGSEIMTSAGFSLGQEMGFRIIYTHLAAGEIFDVIKEEKIADVENLSMDDYLAAMGARRNDDSHPTPKEDRYDDILAVAEYVLDNRKEWAALHDQIKMYTGAEDLKFSVTTDLFFDERSKPSEDALKIFIDKGFVKKSNGRNRYEFTSRESREYMKMYGTWLELYIFIKAKEYFKEVYLGTTIDWNNTDNMDTSDNEIDVIAMHNSIPVFISCKMKRPDSKEIYEVGYLADRLGGPEAKAILATTCDIGAEKELPKGLFQRFRKMNVGFIETDAFKNHTVSDVFERALRAAK